VNALFRSFVNFDYTKLFLGKPSLQYENRREKREKEKEKVMVPPASIPIILTRVSQCSRRCGRKKKGREEGGRGIRRKCSDRLAWLFFRRGRRRRLGREGRGKGRKKKRGERKEPCPPVIYPYRTESDTAAMRQGGKKGVRKHSFSSHRQKMRRVAAGWRGRKGRGKEKKESYYIPLLGRKMRQKEER